MNRYLIERSFPNGLAIPANAAGRGSCRPVAGIDAGEGVTWIHSYVSTDRQKSFCVGDGPSPEAIRKAAGRSGLAVDHITPVTVLDPYFMHGGLSRDAAKRFLVERTPAPGLHAPIGREGRAASASVVAVNAALAVTWIRSYVAADGRKSFCVYEAATAEAVRRASERNALPLDRITEVELHWPIGARE